MRIRELAEVRVSYGYRRIHVLLLREGWKVNHKRVYRLYKQEGLTMRSKKPRRRHVSGRNRIERPVATARNETWSMDFMSDELFNGDRIRLFTLVDHFTRESPAIEVARSIPARRVVEVLDRVTFTPKTVPRGVLVFRDDSGLKREGSSHEEIEVYGRADCLRPQAGGGWYGRRRGVPEDGHLGEHLLQMEEEVFRNGRR